MGCLGIRAVAGCAEVDVLRAMHLLRSRAGRLTLPLSGGRPKPPRQLWWLSGYDEGSGGRSEGTTAQPISRPEFGARKPTRLASAVLIAKASIAVSAGSSMNPRSASRPLTFAPRWASIRLRTE